MLDLLALVGRYFYIGAGLFVMACLVWRFKKYYAAYTVKMRDVWWAVFATALLLFEGGIETLARSFPPGPRTLLAVFVAYVSLRAVFRRGTIANDRGAGLDGTTWGKDAIPAPWKVRIRAIYWAARGFRPSESDVLTHTDQTMRQVYESLMGAGLDESGSIDAVTRMQNKGILFREVPHTHKDL